MERNPEMVSIVLGSIFIGEIVMNIDANGEEGLTLDSTTVTSSAKSD